MVYLSGCGSLTHLDPLGLKIQIHIFAVDFKHIQSGAPKIAKLVYNSNN